MCDGTVGGKKRCFCRVVPVLESPSCDFVLSVRKEQTTGSGSLSFVAQNSRILFRKSVSDRGKRGRNLEGSVGFCGWEDWFCGLIEIFRGWILRCCVEIMLCAVLEFCKTRNG